MELFSRLLHEKGKNFYVKDFKETDPKVWPQEWKTTFYKEYLRFPAVNLPLPETPTSLPVINAIQQRKSVRNFSDQGLSTDQLSILFKYACGEFKSNTPGIEPGGYRAYPSGGARFPIETYLLLFNATDLEPGVYHYNVKNHTLEYMWEGGTMFADTSLLMKSGWTKRAGALIVMTGVFWRNQNKYKARGYRMVCIEAGAITQNIYLLCQSLGLSCVAYAGTNDDQIEELLDLDTNAEQFIASVIIGT